MRKIYSLVLIAAALLVGTNVWADVRPTQQTDENDPTISLDEAKVSKDGGSTWMYATTLKEAFDYVAEGETARIELLKSVTLSAPITMPASIPATGWNNDNKGLLNVPGQNITLDLGNNDPEFTITSSTANVGIFRLIKGTLNIEGHGKIYKESVGRSAWDGDNVIVVCGTASPSAANWSNLTIGKDVFISITPDVKSGTAILIQDHNLLQDGTKIATTDPLYAASYAAVGQKYGYLTYYYETNYFQTPTTNPADLASACGTSKLPMACGAFANSQPSGTTPSDNNFQGYIGVQQGSAYGVNITIHGTVVGGKRALQITGHVNQKPSCVDNMTKRDTVNYPNPPFYPSKYPYIKITSTAKIYSSDVDGSMAIYSSGYGVWDISGEVFGPTGIYMKAGDVRLIDADVRSTSSNNTFSGGSVSGVGEAAGSAIAVESNDAYAGNSGVTITGDTKVTGNGGYAIIDQTYKGDNTSTTSAVTIKGGTIEGGNAGAIAITDETSDVTSISGGNIGSTTVEITHNGSTPTTVNVSDLIPQDNNYHTTIVTIDNKTTVVVSQGSAPVDKTTWAEVAALSDSENPKNVKWTDNTTAGNINSGSIYLGELQMISGDNTNKQELNIKSGATLNVQHLIMNDYARITVEAGGKLIVEGTQGIVAPKVENITLKASANDSYAQFLFNPNVTSNRHPNATVELISDSYRVSASNRHNQHFGIPTAFELAEIVTDREERVAFFSYDYSNESWTSIGSLYYNTDPLDKTVLKDPFGYYQLLCVSATAGTKVTMKGSLVGNDNHEMSYLAHYYMGFANSYTADIDMATLFPTIPGSNKAVYVYQLEGEQDENPQYVWKANTSYYKPVSKIAPMQAFVILNRGVANTSILNYNNMVWKPAKSGSGAPTRQSSYDGMIDIRVSSSNAVDYVTLLEDSRFTSEFEEGEAEKYMNADANIYVSDEMPLSIFATNDMNNTYLGFSCVNGGTYTMKFNSIVGDNYVLVDLLTNATTHIVEGATYTFDAANGETNDYRFQIRKIANVVTDMETVETNGTIQKWGVYTITGQYVGTMNVWNELPSGIYIVDGEKRVK